jgi:LysM repeat protein
VNVDLKGLKPRPRVETLSGGEVAMSDGAGATKDSLSARAASSPRADSSITTSHDSVAAAEPKRRVEARDSSTARPESESVHRVEAGDNLWTIAQRNHTTVKRLQELNNLPTTKLRTGQQLRLR